MKLNASKILLFLCTYANFVCGLTQEEINKLALQVESKMVVPGPVGEIAARNFLKENKIINTNDINAIMNLAFKIKSDPKLKVALSNLGIVASKTDESLTLSPEKINQLALQLEPKMKSAGSEILVRKALSENGITNKNDQAAIVNKIIEIQKNPKLKINVGTTDIQKIAQGSATDLTEQEIKDFALKAESKMKGPMGEFAARKFLKQQGVTNKGDLDAVINKIIELQKSVLQSSDSMVKPIKKLDITLGSKTALKPVEVPVEVEEWAKKLRGFDPASQTFNIIKQLKEGDVEKSLRDKIMSRIRQLRLEKQEEDLSDKEIKDVMPVTIGKEIVLQKFDDLVKLPSVQQGIQFFEFQSLQQPVDIFTYDNKFPVNDDGTLQLWIAVNIESKIHVIINNKNSELRIGQDWNQEFNNMDSLQRLTLDNLKEGIVFSLVQVTKNNNKLVYVYVQKPNGEILAFSPLKNVETLPLEVIWSGSFISNPKKIAFNKSFLLTDNKNLDINKINIPTNLNGHNDNSFFQFIDFKIKNSLPILWQDLVVYFYFTKLELPEETGKELDAYNWVLRHTENAIYKR